MTMIAERTTTPTSPAPTLPNPTITHHIAAGATTVTLPLLHAGQVVWLSATWSRHDHPRAVEVVLDDAPLWACTLPHAAVLALLATARTVALERMGRCQARDDVRAAGVWAELATRLSAEREDYQCSMNDPGYAAWLAEDG